MRQLPEEIGQTASDSISGTIVELELIAENLWIANGESVRWFTIPFPTRMTIIRLESGELFIHSPIRVSAAIRSELDRIGKVSYVVSPNKIHHLFMGEWGAAFPEAKLYASPGLSKKRSDVTFEAELDEDCGFPWSQEIDHLLFHGSRFMVEVVFFHRQSKTLIVGDLIENFDPKQLSCFHRLLARCGGILAPRGGTPRDFQLTFLDRRAARCSANQILAWSPERVILSHGIWVDRDAVPFLERAFSWAGSETKHHV